MPAWIVSSCILLALLPLTPEASSQMNVLLIVSDDLRPQLNCYSGPDFPAPVHPMMYTPNLDHLAARSLLLKRAYVQQAVCSPSRTSLLTGRRPDTTHVYDLVHYFRKVGGNFTTLPQYFKQHGYRSIGMGKVFHPGSASGHDDPPSWSDPYYHPPNEPYWDSHRISWDAVDDYRRRQKPLPDEQTTAHAQKVLRSIAGDARDGSRPFFVAVGFRKPHLPYIFPEEFLGYYPREVIRLPDNEYAPVDMPDLAWFTWTDFRQYKDIKKLNLTGAINSTVPKDVALALRRAYYSAVSYTDSLVGVLLDELTQLGLSNNTIVAFWGDHGYHLGENGEWTKQTNFEQATHAPLIVHIPGVTDHGIAAEALVEFVDLYPTLAEAAGLPPLPLCPEYNSTQVATCREGTSLLPLVRSSNSAMSKDRVFSQFPRETSMGYSMRTERYRYTEWAKFSGQPEYRPDWSVLHGVELYDHQIDPEENVNRAAHAQYADIRKELSRLLRAGWRAAIPP